MKTQHHKLTTVLIGLALSTLAFHAAATNGYFAHGYGLKAKGMGGLLRRIYEGLVEGGALIIAEKTVAETGRIQDAITFPYYDFKIKMGFSEKDILDKERALRGQMTLWTETELKRALRQVGFREIESIWRNYMFVGHLALK